MGETTRKPGPNWLDEFGHKRVTPAKAIELVDPGDRIFVDSGCAEPQQLTAELVRVHNTLVDTEILHFLTIGTTEYFEEKIESIYRHNTFFIGENLRQAVWDGQADYTPLMLSEIPHLFQSGRIPVDVVLLQVSPPDEHGFCSYGVNVDIVKSIAENARTVVAEVNPQMPRTLGDSFIHMDAIDAFVFNDAPILEFKYEAPGEVARSIAKHVSKLVLDESTIQMGIGNVPNAMPAFFEDKKDLGVHSEVFSDGIVALVDRGVVTCAKKTLHRGKIVTSFVMGSRKLYDFVDDNPFVEFHPCEYVNDPFVISRNRRQVAINAALNVDLTGQVNSDSLGFRFYSGIGGQRDFVVGASRAPEGKAVMTLPSTTEDGTKSRIVPFLVPGSGVTITRGEVEYIVTEYGIAYLKGKSIRDRALALISIAHPDFRDQLLKIAKKMHYVYQDQQIPVTDEGHVVLYPDKYETWQTFKDGRRVFFRPIKFTDERKVQEFVYALDQQSRYYRFFSPIKFFGHDKAQDYVIVNYEDDIIIVGLEVDPVDPSKERIVAAGGYHRDPKTNFAEISFMVATDYRNIGITKFLLEYLIRIAKENGIVGFNGEILAQNRAMIHIIKNAGYDLFSEYDQGEFMFSFKFGR
ncbi:MAG: GNAT family N-acetyltransferase [Promethearchaeota archaeon]